MGGWHNRKPNGTAPAIAGSYGGTVSLTSGASSPVPLVKLAGDDVLDLTNPNDPAVLSAGVYIVTVMFYGELQTLGGTAIGVANAYDTPTFDNQLAQSIATLPFAGSGNNTWETVAFVVRMPATGIFELDIQNNDGVAEVVLNAEMTIAKISD